MLFSENVSDAIFPENNKSDDPPVRAYADVSNLLTNSSHKYSDKLVFFKIEHMRPVVFFTAVSSICPAHINLDEIYWKISFPSVRWNRISEKSQLGNIRRISTTFLFLQFHPGHILCICWLSLQT